MPSQFLSSEEYDERAHQLYNEGQYDEALDVLREGLGLYPTAVELHVGLGYARLAREEYAWARRTFEESLVLDPEHEDALAGLGETLLKFRQRDAALRCFRQILELGYQDDTELMLQVGRALFREHGDSMPLMAEAKEFFDIALAQQSDSAEATSYVGYAEHRLGDEDAAIATLRRALQLDAEYSEARIYLGNLLYDRGDAEAALYHLDRTVPGDHWEEFGIFRLLELKKSIHRIADDDPEMKSWEDRIAELGEMDDIDELLDGVTADFHEALEGGARNQLELFGALLTDFVEKKTVPDSDEAADSTLVTDQAAKGAVHLVRTQDGREFVGTWEAIVRGMQDAAPQNAVLSLEEFMRTEAVRVSTVFGVTVPATDAESFVRGSASAGLLRIVQ